MFQRRVKHHKPPMFFVRYRDKKSTHNSYGVSVLSVLKHNYFLVKDITNLQSYMLYPTSHGEWNVQHLMDLDSYLHPQISSTPI